MFFGGVTLLSRNWQLTAHIFEVDSKKKQPLFEKLLERSRKVKFSIFLMYFFFGWHLSASVVRGLVPQLLSYKKEFYIKTCFSATKQSHKVDTGLLGQSFLAHQSPSSNQEYLCTLHRRVHKFNFIGPTGISFSICSPANHGKMLTWKINQFPTWDYLFGPLWAHADHSGSRKYPSAGPVFPFFFTKK